MPKLRSKVKRHSTVVQPKSDRELLTEPPATAEGDIRVHNATFINDKATLDVSVPFTGNLIKAQGQQAKSSSHLSNGSVYWRKRDSI